MPRSVAMPGPCHLLLPETASIPEWLHARSTGVGGSEVAALLGVSPYATSWDVWKAKVDDSGAPRFIGEEPVPGPKIRAELLTDNKVFEWGHRLENAVRLKIADVTGMVARPGGGLWQHNDHPLAIVTPDGVATKRRSYEPVALIECKTAGDVEGWDNDTDGPLHYQVQAQWQMGITGIHTCLLGCFILNFERDFFLKEVKFDQEWFDEMVAIAEKFWAENVLTGEPPEHDFKHKRTAAILKESFPLASAPPVHLDQIDGCEEWLEVYFKAKATIEQASASLEEAKNWLEFWMGEASRGFLYGEKVISWPEVHTRRISVTKLREKYPDIAAELEETSTHRRFTARRPKPKSDTTK